jgi:hypothetical protein
MLLGRDAQPDFLSSAEQDRALSAVVQFERLHELSALEAASLISTAEQAPSQPVEAPSTSFL